MTTKSTAAEALAAQRSRFRAFVVSRLGNEAEADDLLQNSLIKALRSADTVRDDEKLTAWFHQILRRAIVDHIRSRAAARTRDDAWAAQERLESDHEAERSICGCFEALLPNLKPREAELLCRVELQNESVADAAQALGITPNNAGVILHRARRALRDKLVAFCGSCAGAACLDCDCPAPQN